MHDPHQALRRPPRRVAGVLSGTSADGIDVAVAAPRYESLEGATRLVGLEQLAFTTEPFPEGLGERVRTALERGPGEVGAVALLHRDLGRAFGAAARRVAAETRAGPLDLVASHGQTVFHHDGVGPAGPATLQLGDGDEVAEAAGCGAVTDLRTRDVAAGGEGAPLVALVDDVLFRDAPRPLAVLNLGGIANWTVLGEGDEPARAFDAGPAGALLDGLARRLIGRPFDDGGGVALTGRPDAALLERLLDHPFLLAIPPKSTGRDTFGEAWVEGVLADAGHLTRADVLATAARFVARAAADALEKWGLNGDPGGLQVAVGGGGAHNAAVGAALDDELGQRGIGAPIAAAGGRRWTPTSSLGVDPDAREALAFAALGARFAVGEPSTSPAATGAATGRVLGKWSPAPPGGSRVR